MPRKPIWTEGLFVSQHHFQAQDLYHEHLLRERIASIRRFEWGIVDIAVDERLLRLGQFGLTRLHAIWPDGLVARCGGPLADPLPESRSFEGMLLGEAARLDVLVGVISEGASANLPGFGEAEPNCRFSRSTDAVADFSGGAVQDIEIAVPDVRILFGTERRDGLSTLPVAQLVRQANGEVVLRETFVPPTLHIAAAPFLTDGLRRLLGAMISRQRELAAARKQRHVASVEFHHADARSFWLLHTLNAAIPALSHLLDTPRVHPEEVFLALANLSGQLSTFAPEADPTTIPRFDYAALGDVFERLFAHVLSLLSVDSAASYEEVAIEKRPDGMFVGKIRDARLTNHEFFIAVRSKLPESAVRDRLPRLLKVAAWTHIAEVVQQARRGVRVDVDWSPSSALPVKPGVCFFRLRREGAFWEEIAKSRTLALYLPADGEWNEVGLSVYAIDPKLAN